MLHRAPHADGPGSDGPRNDSAPVAPPGDRYTRHLRIPEVGADGQQKLRAARVALVGTGGLGSPAALYLAAAGVGTLGLIDDDVVDVTNLQRQILHRTDRVGVAKTQSARQTLGDLNPEVQVEAHPVRLTPANAEAILSAYDLVVDGCDNFPTRYLINEVCLKLRRPYVYGSVFRFEGQASVFMPFRGPCYRCLYPQPPPAEQIPAPEETGVLGVLPGVIGTVQATEALKLILDIGRPLVGRLLVYDALDLRFHEFQVTRRPDCAACG